MSANAVLRITAAELDSRSNAGGVAVWREAVSVKVLRMAATCCFWQRRHKEAAQRLKQWRDLKLLAETVATDLVCQTLAPAAETYTTVRSVGLESSVVLFRGGS